MSRSQATVAAPFGATAMRMLSEEPSLLAGSPKSVTSGDTATEFPGRPSAPMRTT
jgi:hypothetical protein